MALDATTLHAHARVTVDGEECTVYSTDAGLTYLVAEDGKVSIRTTESVLADGELVLNEAQQQEVTASDDKDAEIQRLKDQLAQQQGESSGSRAQA